MRIRNSFEEFLCLRSNLRNVMLKWFLPKGQVWRRVWILDVWSENWLFTVPSFSVRSSRYSSSYQLPSCMSPAHSVHFEITMAAINGKISWRSHGKIRDSEQSSLKTGVENDIFLSEIGSGFGEPGGTPSPRILRSTPPSRAFHLLLLNTLTVTRRQG